MSSGYIYEVVGGQEEAVSQLLPALAGCLALVADGVDLQSGVREVDHVEGGPGSAGAVLHREVEPAVVAARVRVGLHLQVVGLVLSLRQASPP